MLSSMVTVPKANLQGALRHWEARMERARELRACQPAAGALLQLYEAVLQFQCEVARAAHAEVRTGTPLGEQIDPALPRSFLPSLLQIIVEHGPEELGDHARILQQNGEPYWDRILKSALGRGDLTEVEDFVTRACLQPCAENLQSQVPPNPNWKQARCPACGGLPQLAILRPEGEGATRWLQCSFCLREWLFRRIICPLCGEEDKEKLPRYSAEECAHVHIQACDTCKRYLKAVDMTVDGRAVPVVDEAAWAVLDVWAASRGYTKIVRNLVGF